jgi:hypothetical protein
MKAISTFVLVVVVLSTVPVVSAVPDEVNFESPVQFTAEGAPLSPEKHVNTPCGRIQVPVFEEPENSEAQLFRKWFNDEYADYRYFGLV